MCCVTRRSPGPSQEQLGYVTFGMPMCEIAIPALRQSHRLHSRVLDCVDPRGGAPSDNMQYEHNSLRTIGHDLETSSPGALYREFQKFMRILTTLIEKPTEVYHNSHKRPKRPNYDGCSWAFSKESRQNSHEFLDFPVQCTRLKKSPIAQDGFRALKISRREDSFTKTEFAKETDLRILFRKRCIVVRIQDSAINSDAFFTYS